MLLPLAAMVGTAVAVVLWVGLGVPKEYANLAQQAEAWERDHPTTKD